MIEFDIDIEIKSKKLRVYIEADARLFKDRYGDDADGNRGKWVTECEDLELSVRDARGNDLTKELEKFYPILFEAIKTVSTEKLIEQYEESEPNYE